MSTAEELLFSAVDRDEFWQACQACFSGQSGAVVLRALAALSHPLTPPVGRDALETYRLIGRAEIVSLLLRYSEAQVSPAHLAQYHASQTETRNAGDSGSADVCSICTDATCRGCESRGNAAGDS